MSLNSRLGVLAIGSVLCVGSGFIACQGTTSDPTPGGSGSATLLPTPTPAPAAPASAANHPRVITSQTSRIFNAQVAADKKTQLDALQAQLKASPEALGSPNFSIATYKPVVGNVAIFGASFTSSSNSDTMFFGTQTGGAGGNVGVSSSLSGCSTCATDNFFAVNNLHTGALPSLVWSTNISGGTSAAVSLSADGTKVYALSDNGGLYCFTYAGSGGSAAKCSGWASNPVSLSISGSAITPWVDTAANAIYVANGSSGLYRINATSGTKQWGGSAYTYSTNAGSGAWPLESNNIIYIGDGAGAFWRIQDPTTGTADTANAAAPSSSSSYSLASANGNCNGTSAVNGSVSLDSTSNLVFIPYEGCMVSFPHYCANSAGCSLTSGSWTAKAAAWTGSIPAAPFQTWPTLDGTYVYWVIPNVPTSYTNVSAVWKEPYSLTTTVQGTPLVNASSSAGGATATSAPIVWNSLLYVGDTSGYVEEFGCASTKSKAAVFAAETNAAGGAVNTGIEFDDATGNIEYGYTGGIVQFPLYEQASSTHDAGDFSWTCPTGQVPCTNQLCGVGANLVACVPTAECTTGASCSTVAAAGDTVYVGVAGSEGASVTGSQGSGGNQICPTGQVIVGVLGASYGTPPSSDGTAGTTFSFSSSCYSNNSLLYTEKLCPLTPGEENCTFDSYNGTFGDPCVGTGKNYYAWFACGSDLADGGVPNLCSRQNVVPPGAATDPCVSGTCTGTCSTGWGDCNTNLQYDGCETYILGTDISNCGGCGSQSTSFICSAPSNAQATCTNGSCGYACNSGTTTCGTSCCAAPTNGSATCSGSTCGIACNSGYSVCNGACIITTDYQTDNNNCGGCGVVCSGGTTCISGSCAEGETFTASGTFTVPAGVTSISVVVVGGGGGGASGGTFGTGGGGGELCYENAIAATPGDPIDIIVGAGGTSGATPGAGGLTALIYNSLQVYAIGGSPGVQGASGTTSGTGGAGGTGGMGTCFNGGNGGNVVASSTGIVYGGGGGAGGYSGAGGNGGNASNATTSCVIGLPTAATAGTGGAGGGGGAGSAASAATVTVQGGSGGGVGLYGSSVGTNGNAGTAWCSNTSASSASGGKGGSVDGNGGGLDGLPATAGTGQVTGAGGAFGGGAGGGSTSATGGAGAVRIIWGTGRSFPSNANP